MYLVSLLFELFTDFPLKFGIFYSKMLLTENYLQTVLKKTEVCYLFLAKINFQVFKIAEFQFNGISGKFYYHIYTFYFLKIRKYLNRQKMSIIIFWSAIEKGKRIPFVFVFHLNYLCQYIIICLKGLTINNKMLVNKCFNTFWTKPIVRSLINTYGLWSTWIVLLTESQ